MAAFPAVAAGGGRRERRAGKAGPVDGRVDRLFVALGDPTRRRLLEELARRGPATARELAPVLGVTGPTVTRHLLLLMRAGVLCAQRAGRQTRYALVPGAFDVGVGWLAARLPERAVDAAA
jgi:DNA-binding transcriptional ArsR family regulator